METQQLFESYQGHEVKVTVSPNLAGAWQSTAEVDLGKTGCVVFENNGQSYASAQEAHEAALALAAENLSRSRVGKSKP